jgi:tmRNA-binding protein
MNEVFLTEAEINKYEHESALVISGLIEKRSKLMNKKEVLEIELSEIDKSILDVQTTVKIFYQRSKAIA